MSHIKGKNALRNDRLLHNTIFPFLVPHVIQTKLRNWMGHTSENCILTILFKFIISIYMCINSVANKIVVNPRYVGQ